MKWDLSRLRAKIETLGTIKDNITDEKEREQVKNEILCLQNMVLELTGAPSQSKAKIYLDETRESMEAKRRFFEDELSSTTFDMHQLSSYSRLPYYFMQRTRINYDEYVRLVEGFLSEFKLNLMGLYSKMKGNNQIQLTAKAPEDFLGICYYISFINESYIKAFFGRNLENCELLLHELGHAYAFNGVNYDQKQNMTLSSIGEAFPMFMQLAFYDYLAKTKYWKVALNFKRNALESLHTYLEKDSAVFMHATSVKNVDGHFLNEDSNLISEYEANRFLSKALSYHLAKLYRTRDFDGISEYIEAYRSGKEYDYYRTVGSKGINTALRMEFENFHECRKNR